MRPEWLGPAAVLAGAAAISLSIVWGASRIAIAIERRAPAAETLAAPPAGSTSSVPPAESALAPTPAALPEGASLFDGGILELPIVTYDSFDRRFAGTLAAEAEARCWLPAAKQGPLDEVVYLNLDVAVDGRVVRAEVERPPQPVAPPTDTRTETLRRCIAEVASKVVFMRLPAPVTSARVAVHRPKK